MNADCSVNALTNLPSLLQKKKVTHRVNHAAESVISIMTVKTTSMLSLSQCHKSVTTRLLGQWPCRENMRRAIKIYLGEGGGWRRVQWLEALLVMNSPIFSLRLIYMTVGASSHFASFVLKQVLDTLSFAGQFHFKIIVHFHLCVG